MIREFLRHANCRRSRPAFLALVAMLAIFIAAPQLPADEPYARSRDYDLQHSKITLRFDLTSGRRLHEPQFRTRGPVGAKTNVGPHFVTTAHGPELFPAAQQAIRYMIDHLVAERGLSREEAYALCSVAVDLKISEIVDAPNWIVSAFLPESIFT